MKPVERFFRKYLLSMIGIIVLFLLLNILLFLSMLVWVQKASSGPEISIHDVWASVTVDETGKLTAADGLDEQLQENHSWAMILDGTGAVVWEERLPEELPRRYTPVDVAKFSRWYLRDYPVFVLEHPAGLLVVGTAKNSFVKYCSTYKEPSIRIILAGLAVTIAANLIAVVLLIWWNMGRVEKAVTPILRGIETVSSGHPVSLPEKGELAEINRQLNKAGAFIVKKDSARADWISGVSHDVRTPLSVILGFAGQLEDNQTLPAPAREQAACIRKQGEKLRNLISDLNLASRLEYSMQPLRLEKIYLVELARQVVCEFLDSGLQEQYRIAFSSDQESEMASIMGDEALLKRALYNLIQNSMIHNSSGCDISVSVSWSGNHTVITVSDNGIGVTAEKLEELKANTHRIESTDERLNLRHGLGIWLVWQIVEAHHGTMEIFSEPQMGYQTVLTFSNGGI